MGNLDKERIKLHQPYKIINFQKHPICTMAYDTNEEAMDYGRSIGLKDYEIYVEVSDVEEKWIREF